MPGGNPPTHRAVSQSVSQTAVNAARLKLFDADTASCSEQHARLTLGRDDAAAARIALRYAAAAAKFTTLSVVFNFDHSRITAVILL